MKQTHLIKILAIVLLSLLISLLIINFTLADVSDEKQEVRSELLKLNEVKQEMSNAGLGVERVADLITEGFMHYNNNDYNKTRKIIDSVYDLKDTTSHTQKELSLINQSYQEIKARNLSMDSNVMKQIETDLKYAQREFEKENYEGALKTLGRVKSILVSRISQDYAYLNATILLLEEKVLELELSKSRISMLKELFSEALADGKISELRLIKQEVKDLNQSLAYYEEIKLAIPVIESKNLSAQRIKDELKANELDLSFGDYENAVMNLESLKALVELALKLEQEAGELEKEIEEEKAKHKIAFGEVEAHLLEAKYELRLGNYEEAEQELEKAKSLFENRKAELIIGGAGSGTLGVNLADFIRKNWVYLVIIIFLILLVLKLTHHSWSYTIRKKRISSLKKELKVSEKMVQTLQRDYFVHRKMGKEKYEMAYEDLQEKIMKLKDKLSQLNKKVNK